MKRRTVFLLLVFLLILSGCWSKQELTEWGFVMGVALDSGKDGNINMTTQFYRPQAASGKGQSGGEGGGPNLYIKVYGKSIQEAIQNLPMSLGRKAQWSHMRVIVVSEKLAKTVDIGKLLDVFFRDHEPRPTISIMVSKGSAGNLLKKKPIIEQTTGQQLLRVKEFSYRFASKTLDTSLLDLGLQLKSAHNDAYVSYVSEHENDHGIFSAAGLSLFKRGKMTSILPPKKVEGLLMLRNEYRSGIIEIPCPDRKDGTETMEILSLQTKVQPNLKGDKITVDVTATGDGAIGELKCTTIGTIQEEAAFIRKAEEKMKNRMLSTIRFLQTKKMDVIGIGNYIYRMHPNQWNQIKKNWDNQFADISFDVHIKVRLVTSGTTGSKPALYKSK